jgi:hypothetical protein
MRKKMMGVAVIFVVFMSGCIGMYSAESFTSVIGCIFYGDCDYYPGYFEFVVFEGTDDQPIHSLVGSWTHRSAKSEHYYILNLNADQTLALQHYMNGKKHADRVDQGRYEVADDTITITMNNGTRSVITFVREDNSLYMALPDLL